MPSAQELFTNGFGKLKVTEEGAHQLRVREGTVIIRSPSGTLDALHHIDLDTQMKVAKILPNGKSKNMTIPRHDDLFETPELP